MSNTITAIFRTDADADLVRRKLVELGVSERYVTIIGGNGRQDDVDTLNLPDDEASTYRQAVGQGHYIVSAEVEDDQIDATAEIMRHPEQGVDIDSYETDYRAGPEYAAAGAAPATATDPDQAATGSTEGEQVIPVAEERLTVGKRTVEHGSAHVRTYVQEVPVEERVRLREERLSVDRRPVNETVSGADAEKLFQDRDIDVTTRSEEAVVTKEAVITEEVVIGKEVTEHEEVVEETVRKTEVEVDKDRD